MITNIKPVSREGHTRALPEKVSNSGEDSVNGEIEERLAVIEGILKEMSVHTWSRLDSLDARLDFIETRLDGKAGKWELRVWMLVLIAVAVIFKFVT